MGGGGGDSETYSKYRPYQQEYFDKILEGAWGKYQDGGFYDPNYGGGGDTYAGWSPEQEAYFERITGSGGSLDQALSGLERQLGPYDPNNTGVTGAIDAATSDIYRQLNEQTLVAGDQAAANVGQYGSSRHGIAEGLATRGANEQAGDIAAEMRYKDYNQYQQNQQNALHNYGNIMAGLMDPFSQEQRNRQGGLDDDFSRWEYETGLDLANLEAIKRLLSGDMGGETWGSGESGGK